MSFGGKGSGHAGRFTFPEQHSINNSKTPPGWGVEKESTYPFNCWIKDLVTWAYATDLDAEKQAHAVVLRLTGTARVLAQEIDPNILAFGDTVDVSDGSGPQALNGLAILMHRLSQRYGSQDTGTQLTSLRNDLRGRQENPWTMLLHVLARYHIDHRDRPDSS